MGKKKNRKNKRKRKAKTPKKAQGLPKQKLPVPAGVQAWMYLTDLNVLRDIRQQMRKTHGRESCINGINILRTIAADLGLVVDPMTVETHVSNAVISEWMDKNPGAQMTDEEGEILQEQGGKYLIIGERGSPASEPDNWAGHLVGVLRPPTDMLPIMVIDLSIDQINRPAHDIVLEKPIILKLTKEKLHWLNGGVILGVEKNNVRVTYRAFPEDQSFRQASGWTRTYDPQEIGEMLCTPSAI